MLVMVTVVSRVVGHKLTGFFRLGDEIAIDEIDHSVTVRLTLEVEVDTISAFFDACGLLGSIVLQDHLLQVQEGPLMMHALSDLNAGHPSMWCPLGLTLVTLEISDGKLDDECLLEHSVVLHFFLHC